MRKPSFLVRKCFTTIQESRVSSREIFQTCRRDIKLHLLLIFALNASLHISSESEFCSRLRKQCYVTYNYGKLSKCCFFKFLFLHIYFFKSWSINTGLVIIMHYISDFLLYFPFEKNAIKSWCWLSLIWLFYWFAPRDSSSSSFSSVLSSISVLIVTINYQQIFTFF